MKEQLVSLEIVENHAGDNVATYNKIAQTI
jgi:hypothetical protein